MNAVNPAEIRILVVDDDPDVLNGTLGLLKEAGYTVDPAASGEDTLRALQRRRPDLILLDRNLPGIDGIEVCRRIKRDPALGDIPVVIVSASCAESDEQAEGLESGADGYISLPIANREMLARVESFARIISLTRTLRLQTAELEKRAQAAIRAQEASLNLMEDAVEARNRLEVRNQELQREIAERLQAEGELLESEKKYRSIFDNAVEGIFQTTPEGGLLTANPALARIFGYDSPKEFMGELTDTSRQSYVNAARRKEFLQLMETRGAVESFEHEAYRKDRSRIWVSENVRVVRDADGRVIYYEGTLQDITERKRAADRIREQATLLDTANDAIYVTTLDCTIVYWNQGAERVYGWTSAEALNRKTTELISPDSAAAEGLAALLLKQDSWSGERRQNTKSGRAVDIFSRLTLVRDQQGQPRSVFAINTDITEKKQLEARFLQAQRLESLGALASGIAHDLNNVLSPILMAAAILRGKAQTDSERSMLTTMEACARRGSGIIRQVLTFARGIEGKRIPLQPRHLLREIATIVGETFPKNIELEMDVEKELWPVLGDTTQLHQVLMNLCVNARDAMPEGGRLGLNAENIELDETFALMTPGAKSGPYVHLIISDTGTGIPPKLFDKIFDPFFTTKAPGKGTGLGLSTVLGIVRSHDGFIQFKSEVGKGTCFEVYLPAALDVKPVAGPDPRSAPPQGKGELILVVDDEIAIRTVATKILEVFGYRVVSASDGTEALAAFMQNRSDIAAIVTDMLMPGMDGPTFVRVVRRIEPGIRIIGISGVGEGTTVDIVESLGLSALLLKPFTGASLAFEVHAVLQAPPGTKVRRSASPWRGVSAAPWGSSQAEQTP